jgi:phytoene dehydrogenase-like protein
VTPPEAIVVGSGPNGFAAAITLARAGLVVEVYEGSAAPGGGCRTAALTEPGFLHDVCSAVHPLLSESPFFRQLELERRGLEMATPRVAFAHPIAGDRAASVRGTVEQTAHSLAADGYAYRRTLSSLVRHSEEVVPALLAPLRRPPAHPVVMAKFAARGLPSVRHLVRRFETDEARALLAGAAAHSMLRLDQPLTASYGLLMAAMAHTTGWPFVRGGSGQIVAALVEELESLGGRVTTGRWVETLDELPAGCLVLLDVTPRQLLLLAGSRLPSRYRRALERFRYGPGVCKVDFALSEPVPWSAEECRQAGTVHVGGTFEEVAAAESEVAAGHHPERPFCLVAQPGVVDESRAPQGSQTLWAYCHVPSGSTIDLTARVEEQIERFAPGFRDTVIARTTMTAAELERYNPNDVGGDVAGGAADLRQTLFRPVVAWNPYRTPLPGVYLCSASTPPGGGVHGMCGYHAARVALADAKKKRSPAPA